MTRSAARHKEALLAWLDAAVAGGWIDEEEREALQALESQGAEALFADEATRPLTVGLFGGTGVGKSSLLNRLVGEAVAAVGVERPTSTEVTLYIHEDDPLEDLARFLPVDRVQVLVHRHDEYRHVVWIDMPDIDSVERTNRELVLAWLPYIDWLIYVVSPERYRDDAGWRILAERGHRHHWLFVMNRWDNGTIEQYRDFARILADAGFDGSELIGTSCTAPDGDEFDRITSTIDAAVAEHGLVRLQEIGERARLKDLHRLCDRYAEMLGGTARWRDFISRGEAVLTEKTTSLIEYLKDETAIEAARVARRDAGAGEVAAPALPRLTAEYVQDIESAIAVVRAGLPAAPVSDAGRPVLASLEERLAEAVSHGFREGTARPGSALQRVVVAVMKKLVFGLPLAAALGIAWVVVSRFPGGLSGSEAFLGFDFLAHALMVLALSALAPWLAARLLRPSVRRSIVRRVEAGLRRVRAETTTDWTAAMNEVLDRWRAMSRSLDQVREAIENDL